MNASSQQDEPSGSGTTAVDSAGRLFYGWRIVSVSFVALFISVGFSFYSYGAFFKALAAEFGGSRLGISLGQTLMFTVTGLLAPFLGRQVDHRSIRNLMTFGAVLVAVGFVLISRITSLWQFYLVYGTVLAVGLAFMGQLPTSALVANWFVRRRGMALGIATMGVSMSGVIMAPAATWLIEHIGWRNAFVLYGAVTLVVIVPAVWTTVVNRPEDLGQFPDGGPEPPSPERKLREIVTPLASGEPPLEPPVDLSPSGPSLVRDRNFWVIASAVALNFCANGAILTHLIPHVTDQGFPATRAALVLSAAAALGVVGKVIFGWVADHVDLRLALGLATSFQVVAVVGLLVIGEQPSYRALLITGAIFGLGMGGLVPLWGSMVGAAFGRRSFGRAMGLMSPVMIPIQILGVPFAGFVFDRTGSYTPAFATFVVIYIAAIVVTAFLKVPHRELRS
jgi:MFS family permease